MDNHFIHHTNGTVDFAAAPLPSAGFGASSLHRLSAAALRLSGWLPVRYENESFDPAVQDRSAPSGVGIGDTVELDADEAVGVYTVTAKLRTQMTDAVNFERDQRLATTFTFDFADARGEHTFSMAPSDFDKWTKEVFPLAVSRVLLNRTTPIAITTETGVVQVTPTEFLEIIDAAAPVRQGIYAKSFAIKSLDPIPPDLADDARW